MSPAQLDSDRSLSPGPNRQRRHNDRKNATRACEYCRGRKTRCTGESPRCLACQKQGRTCVYPVEVDKRATDRTAILKIEQLQARVQELEIILSATKSASLAFASPTTHAPEFDPFQTGCLILSSTGNLHLHPSATFYQPASLIPEWETALQSLPKRRVPLPGYLASYLPFPMMAEHHARLIDFAFEGLLSFGAAPFKDRFVQGMNLDPDVHGLYFSPILHLCVLGIGWRYCQDLDVISMYYPGTDPTLRGDDFMDMARDMVLKESNSVQLSNILSAFFLALYYVGCHKDSMSGMVGQFQCMDLRLHKRCDEQLRDLGLAPDSELDIARRDVWGFALNLCAWWATFYGQPALSLVTHKADQRLPRIQYDAPDEQTRLLSIMACHQVELSPYGLDALEINHVMKLPMEMRVKQVRAITEHMVRWKAYLPAEVNWPPQEGGPIMHPGILTTHGMYTSYIILLYRPYIIEVGGGRSHVPEALEKCVQCTRDIVALCHYMVKHHGIRSAPLSFQHVLYVCATLLVLQTAGLPGVTSHNHTWALESLSFLEGVLDEFAWVWPTAAFTLKSLRELQAECAPAAGAGLGSGYRAAMAEALAAHPAGGAQDQRHEGELVGTSGAEELGVAQLMVDLGYSRAGGPL
ncbi:hypothetical protein IAT38_005041 [Cryptococcus sp. DSM 104549]